TNRQKTKIGDRFSFWLAADQVGVRKPDPRIFRMAAAAADCHPRELVHVGDEIEADVLGAKRAGVRAVLLDRHGRMDGAPADAVIRSLTELPDLIRRWDEEELRSVGVGPHSKPWPDHPRLDPALRAPRALPAGVDWAPAGAVIRSLTDLPDLVRRWDAEELRSVGVRPHSRPWPDDPRLDPELLAHGDRRNVVARYRYWRNEAIVADLDR